MTTYAAAGVNIEIGDDARTMMFKASQNTWKFRQGLIGEIINPFEDFTGLRMIDLSNLPAGTVACLGFDGVGTKVEIAERLNKHYTVAFDLLAMVCDDAVVRGGEPVLVGTVLDVNSLGSKEKPFFEQMNQLAMGYVKAAEAANVAVINGEVAELGKRISGYGSFNYNWSGTVLWLAKKERLFTGKEIKAGDKIVALEEEGFRSNGLSLARKILTDVYGGNWHEELFREENSIGELMLTPSKIYCKCVCAMFGGYAGEAKAAVHGVVHVTGGGVPGKLARVLKPSGLGAELPDLLAPSPIMEHVQEIGQVKDDEAYKTWNMGQGMLIITPEPEKVIEIAYQHNINAQVTGEVNAKAGIRIESKGRFKKGTLLRF